MNYDGLKNLFTKEKWIDSTSEIKDLYVIIRFLSMHPETFEIAADATRFQRRLPDWAIASYLFKSVPKKNKSPYIKYISKKDPANSDKERRQLRKLISRHLCCSKRHAEETICILESANKNPYLMFGLKHKGK